MISIPDRNPPLPVRGSRGPQPHIANARPEVLAVIGLCWMGYTDYEEIARLAGIGRRDQPNAKAVENICESPLKVIRDALRDGLPRGVCGTLKHPVFCPQCRHWLLVAPCLHCTLANAIGPHKSS